MRVRPVVRRIHLCLGLTAGLLWAVSGLTGSVLAFGPEIDRALNPSLLRASPPAGAAPAAPLPLRAVAEAVRARFPSHTLLYLRLPGGAGDTYEVWADAPDGRRVYVYVDPYGGGVLGSRGARDSLVGWAREAHIDLLGGPRGHTLVGVSALACMPLLVTGLWLWWPGRGWGRLRGALSVKWSAPAKRVNYDLHRAVGAASSLVLAAGLVTGAALVFHEAARWAVESATASPPRPPPPASSVPAAGAAVAAPSLDEMVGAAEAQLPGARTTWVYLPQSPQAPLTVRRRFPSEAHPNGNSFVYVDRYTGRVLSSDPAARQSRGSRLFNLLYPTHTGAVAGTAGRACVAAVGLAPALLFVTGFFAWRNRARGAARRAAAPAPPSLTPRSV